MSFDEIIESREFDLAGLNPFGTGQCLSTQMQSLTICGKIVSIPLEQGNVFRLIKGNEHDKRAVSQSLWNRAMSFDVSLPANGFFM